MSNPESSIRPLVTDNDDAAGEESRDLHESSPLIPNEDFSAQSPLSAFANEMSDRLGHVGQEDLALHAPSSNDDIEMTEILRQSGQGLSLPASEATAFTREDLSQTSTRILNERTVKSHQPQSSVPTRSGVGWTRAVQGLNRNWTAETLSYIVSILALAGLVTTLLAHQNKPLPQWPQLVTINSIISLFSLLMRAGVGVVLAEGLSQCKWN
ncbi:hypothetical protein B0T12DRAFT_428395 [Alternaria alternata]|nr:hypothetical protein B0T12DRAFT_428395 [Alternaria alternata]